MALYAQSGDDRFSFAAQAIEACVEAQSQGAIHRFAEPRATSPDNALDTATSVWQASSDTLCIDGDLTLPFARWVQDGGVEPLKTVVIRSVGGRGSAGIILAEAMQSWAMHLVVWDHCLSACANGPFIAARQRTIPEPGIVGWHGGAPANRLELFLADRHADAVPLDLAEQSYIALKQSGEVEISEEDWESLSEQTRRVFAERQHWRARQRQALTASGVRPNFLSASTFAVRDAPAPVENAATLYRSRGAVFWSPSAEHLREWGVDNLAIWGPDSQAERFQHGFTGDPVVLLTGQTLDPDTFDIGPADLPQQKLLPDETMN